MSATGREMKKVALVLVALLITLLVGGLFNLATSL
jgi:hypothetical protein